MRTTGLDHQRGSALVYILIAIALLAALTATFMDNSSQQTSSQNTFNTVTELNTQVNFIRSAIQECVLTYPQGDAIHGGSRPNPPYPFLRDADMVPLPPNDEVQYLGCPGNNTSDATDIRHARIFGGSSGKFLPPPPNLFGPWSYYSGADGVFFYTSTDKTDSFLTTALTKLDDQFSECETDVIVDAFNLTSEAALGPGCLADHTCFRVWLIARTPVYQDADELAACP